MRYVVDSNYLQDSGLDDYLARSPRNQAVLTDYVAMEAYNGDDPLRFADRLAILAKYPKQVLVLRGTQAVCALRGRPSGLQRRLVDRGQTASFAESCRALAQAKAGNAAVLKQMTPLKAAANDHLSRMLADARGLAPILDDLVALYSEPELKIIRRQSPYTTEIIDKLCWCVSKLATNLFEAHPLVTRIPDVSEAPNTFIFRNSVCSMLMVLRRAAAGSGTTDPAKLRNDLVDLNFATFATYFDGLLTRDNKVADIHVEARIVLSKLFGAQIP